MLVAVGGVGGVARGLRRPARVGDRRAGSAAARRLVSTDGVGTEGRACSLPEPFVLCRDEVLHLHLAASFLGFQLTAGGVVVDEILVTGC